MTKILQLERFY